MKQVTKTRTVNKTVLVLPIWNPIMYFQRDYHSEIRLRVFHHPVMYNPVDIIIIKIFIFCDIYLLIPFFVSMIEDKARARGST
jgi:hypothetical protein